MRWKKSDWPKRFEIALEGSFNIVPSTIILTKLDVKLLRNICNEILKKANK